AYNMLNVYERFGAGQSVQILDTFNSSILYLLAAPSTPASALNEVVKRAEAGEQLSVAAVKNIVAEHKSPPPEDAPAGFDGSHHDRDRDDHHAGDHDDGAGDHQDNEHDHGGVKEDKPGSGANQPEELA